MKKVKGGITRPKGFLAGAIHCGIKHKNNDLCLIYSQVPAKAAGVFTSNRVKAAPLIISKRNLDNGKAQALVVNSGNANCLMGKVGLNDADVVAKALANTLSIKKSDVLIASTGVIGKRLPVLKIVVAMEELVSSLSPTSSRDVARAIMTTDTVPKETAVSLKIGSNVVNIGAVAKGAGMIHPNMATMLSFITTDAAIANDALKKVLKESVNATFNCITVDGDTSTNDCVFILANGLANNKEIMSTGRDYELFKRALTSVCSTMAEMIIRGAEGATKFIKVNVKRAKSTKDAKKVAYAIATSPLVKTAIYGEDPNWGRIAAAIGKSGVDFNPAKLDIYLGKARVLFQGTSADANKNLLRKIFRKRNIEISAVLNSGNSKATLLTSDLSKEYIDINAHYTS